VVDKKKIAREAPKELMGCLLSLEELEKIYNEAECAKDTMEKAVVDQLQSPKLKAYIEAEKARMMSEGYKQAKQEYEVEAPKRERKPLTGLKGYHDVDEVYPLDAEIYPYPNKTGGKK